MVLNQQNRHIDKTSFGRHRSLPPKKGASPVARTARNALGSRNRVLGSWRVPAVFPSGLDRLAFLNHPIPKLCRHAGAAHASRRYEVKSTVGPDFDVHRLDQGTGFQEMAGHAQPTQCKPLPLHGGRQKGLLIRERNPLVHAWNRRSNLREKNPPIIPRPESLFQKEQVARLYRVEGDLSS